jgi:hypothetical protein
VSATTRHEALLVLNNTPGDATGNQFVSAHDIYRGKHKIGTDGASCQVIDVVGPEQLRVQCVASLSLPAGQITAQGLTVVNEAGTTPFTLAITGGTGAYASANGQVTVRPLDDLHHHAPRLNPTPCSRTHPTDHRRGAFPKNVATPQGPGGCTKEIGKDHARQHDADPAPPLIRRLPCPTSRPESSRDAAWLVCAVIFRVEDEQFVEHWAVCDDYIMLEQIERAGSG